MFKHVTIHLDKPICACIDQPYNWYVYLDQQGLPCMQIICDMCTTSEFVPNQEFLGAFEFDSLDPPPPTRHLHIVK